jgi:hypothetical protein
MAKISTDMKNISAATCSNVFMMSSSG